MAYVYCTHNKINGKKYIGSSRKTQVDPEYFGSGKLIRNAIKKYGINNFNRVILWEGTEDEREIEQYWLDYFDAANNPLFYNMTNDARGNNLHKQLTKDEIQRKITESWSNKTPEEIKSIGKKITQQKTGKPNSKKGKKDGPKPGTSQAHKGRVSPNKGKGKQVALYKITGEYIKTYPNYIQLALDLNINPETVRCHLIGKANTICSKQYKAQYL